MFLHLYIRKSNVRIILIFLFWILCFSGSVPVTTIIQHKLLISALNSYWTSHFSFSVYTLHHTEMKHIFLLSVVCLWFWWVFLHDITRLMKSYLYIFFLIIHLYLWVSALLKKKKKFHKFLQTWGFLMLKMRQVVLIPSPER